MTIQRNLQGFGNLEGFAKVLSAINLQGFGNLEGFAKVLSAINLQGFGNLEGFALYHFNSVNLSITFKVSKLTVIIFLTNSII